MFWCILEWKLSYFFRDDDWSLTANTDAKHRLTWPQGRKSATTAKKRRTTLMFWCIRHSNWPICSHLSPFSSKRFSTFFISYWEANSYYPRGLIMGKGNSSNFKIGWDRGVSVPGAFKLDHFQSIKPLLFWYFCIFFTFILGGQFLLPERANNGKREFTQLQNWMRQRAFSAWGIQTGPFSSL